MWSPINMEVKPAVWLDAWDEFLGVSDSTDIATWNDRSGLGNHFEQTNVGGGTPSRPSTNGSFFGVPCAYFSPTVGEHMSSKEHVPQLQVGTGDFLCAALIVFSSRNASAYQNIVQQKNYTSGGVGTGGLLLRRYKDDATEENDLIGEAQGDHEQQVLVHEGSQSPDYYKLTTVIFYRKNGYMYARRDGNAVDSLDLSIDPPGDPEGGPINLSDLRDPPSSTVSIGNLADTAEDTMAWGGYMFEVILVGDTVPDDDIYRLEGYLAHKYLKDDNDDRYTDGGSFSALVDQAGMLTRLAAGHKYKVDMPASWFGTNMACGDNSLNGGAVGELTGDCSWLISDVQDIQRG